MITRTTTTIILLPLRANIITTIPATRRLASSNRPSSRTTTPTTTTTRRTTRLTPTNRRGPAPDPDAPIHAATKQTIRRIVLTGAVALITIVGAITGARLKTDRDVVKQHQELLELTLEERIAMLEHRRAELVGMKMPLERKLVGLRERVEAEKQKNAAAGVVVDGKA